MRVESTFAVPGMDCPSEEQQIRLALSPLGQVQGMRFDLDLRTVAVVHDGPVDAVLERLEPLGFGARLQHSVEASDERPITDPAAERQVLSQLLAINGVMFAVELSIGLWAQSTGLLADSLDMLADAMVYGVSLFAVGRAVQAQQRAARTSGWLQLALALGALVEVARRAVVGSEPVELLMIGTGSVALVANLACVALLAKHRGGGMHLRASWIFSTNDALANLGVIIAGALVWLLGSAVPDLVVGGAVGLLVLSGAIRILRLSA